MRILYTILSIFVRFLKRVSLHFFWPTSICRCQGRIVMQNVNVINFSCFNVGTSFKQ